MEKFEITIIGGGPVGMFAAFYAGMRNAKTQLVESLGNLGGQVNALYPEKTILDVAGYPAISGRKLIAAQHQQLAQFPLTIRTNSPVTNLQLDHDGFVVTTPTQTSWSKTIILAVGNGAFTPRPLNVANSEALTASGQVTYAVPNPQAFAGQEVLVAGGGNAAIDQALSLADVAQHVTLLHRRNQFRGLEHMVDLLAQSDVTVKTPYLISRLDRTQTGRLAVTIKQVGATAETVLVVDKLLVSYGYLADYHVIEGWDIDLKRDHRLIAVSSTMATSVPGIYAIGDGARYPGKQPLIATGYGEAPLAVYQIMQTYFPDHQGPIHSTSIRQAGPTK